MLVLFTFCSTKQGTLRITIEFEASFSLWLLSNCTATATGAVQRPVLPLAAVLQRGERSAVYAVQDGRFVLRPVRLGAPQGEAGVEVLAGLKTGERYATDAVKAGLAGAVPAPEAARP